MDFLLKLSVEFEMSDSRDGPSILGAVLSFQSVLGPRRSPAGAALAFLCLFLSGAET